MTNIENQMLPYEMQQISGRKSEEEEWGDLIYLQFLDIVVELVSSKIAKWQKIFI